MQRRVSGYIGQRMLKVELPGRWKRVRPQRRFSEGEHAVGWYKRRMEDLEADDMISSSTVTGRVAGAHLIGLSIITTLKR